MMDVGEKFSKLQSWLSGLILRVYLARKCSFTLV